VHVYTDLPTPFLLLLLPIPMAPTQRPRLDSMPESVSEPVAEADFGPGVASIERLDRRHTPLLQGRNRGSQHEKRTIARCGFQTTPDRGQTT